MCKPMYLRLMWFKVIATESHLHKSATFFFNYLTDLADEEIDGAFPFVVFKI
jgi:hypothetical protein